MSSKNLNTRENILKAAWTLLEATPDKMVRISDIAKAAGISRQALYLHFPTRSDLLIATARYLDEYYQVDEHLVASRTAASGVERLDAYIEAWGSYIPKIYGMAKAFWSQQASDEAAAAAWSDRMQAVRHGCQAAIQQLDSDGHLSGDYTLEQATDLLWTLLSVRNWEQLIISCGWSQERYIHVTKRVAHQALVIPS